TRHTRSATLIFSFRATATTENYTLSLHDALPISTKSFIRQPTLRGRTRIASCAGSSSSSGVTASSAPSHFATHALRRHRNSCPCSRPATAACALPRTVKRNHAPEPEYLRL